MREESIVRMKNIFNAGASKNCSSDAIKVVERHLKFGSLKLEQQTCYRVDSEGHMMKTTYQRLGASEEFTWPRGLSHSFSKDRLLWLLKNVYIIYTVIKLFSLAVVHFEYDRLKSKIWPANQLQSYGKCRTNKDNLYDASDYERYLTFDHLLLMLGSPMASLSGAAPSGLALVGSLHPFFYYFGLLSMKSIRPRFDLYDFLLDVRLERRKFRLELLDLVMGLFELHDRQHQHHSAVSLTQRCIRPRYLYVFKQGEGQPDHRSSGSHWCLKSAKIQLDANKENKNCLWVERKLHHLIEPDHLSDRFLLDLARIFSAVPKFLVALCFIPGAIFLAVTICIEIYLRVQYRLDIFECQARNASSIPTGAPVQLGTMELEQHFDAYKYHSDNSSLSSFLELVKIEAGLLFSVQVIMSITEIAFTLAMATILLPLYLGLYMYEYHSKFVWLNQIERQVDECLEQLILKQTNVTEPSELTAMLAGESAPDEADRNKLVTSLTLAYLNYELFRRRQHDYKSLTSPLITQMALTCALSLLSCYLVCAFISSAYLSVPLMLATYETLLLNVYLITSAIRTSRTLKLMKNFCRIVAFSAENSLNDLRIIKLWSLQIFTQERAIECFAPIIFGFAISYERIFAINASLMALWFLALWN